MDELMKSIKVFEDLNMMTPELEELKTKINKIKELENSNASADEIMAVILS